MKQNNVAEITKTKTGSGVESDSIDATRDLAAAGKASTAAKSKGRARKAGSSDGNDSILNWYLNEIHKIPMLDREQEMEVARRAELGEQEARDLLVRSNLRFVVTVARRYQSYGLTMMDLINEGNMGLIKAAEKFNPDRGFHFISYAVWWIKQSILFAIQQKSHLIRLPLNRTAELRRLEEAERWIENQEGMENNLQSLAQVLDMKPEDLNHLMTMSRDHLSLDAPMGEGEDYSLGENIEDASAVMPEDDFENSDLKRDINDCLGGLTNRERKVLSMRFGLGGGPVLSLQKIGQAIGLSKERIRQIEKKAIRKIRTGKCGQDLMAYL
ncbi:MAG: RNA polymerase sigma factor RpoD/SigA [Leptospirales bacterium]|jgi:RNA polymerase primary sigma factor